MLSVNRNSVRGFRVMRGSNRIHRLALLGLIVVAIVNVATMFRNFVVAPIFLGTVVIALAFWYFLIAKLRRAPREWSLGIAIWLLLMAAFQIWLWTIALSRPDRARLGAYGNPMVFALNELPLFFTAACCFILRSSLSRRAD